jgi:hypothetical protein
VFSIITEPLPRATEVRQPLLQFFSHSLVPGESLVRLAPEELFISFTCEDCSNYLRPDNCYTSGLFGTHKSSFLVPPGSVTL